MLEFVAVVGQLAHRDHISLPENFIHDIAVHAFVDEILYDCEVMQFVLMGNDKTLGESSI